MKERRAPYRKWLCQFNIKDPVLMLKVRHINNVVQFAKIIANKRRLSKQDEDLAVFIAQHHDDGRFIQWRDYHTFRDVAICDDGKKHPHAELGIKMLFDDRNIERFTYEISDEEYKIVYKAIAMHGDLLLDESGMTEREICHCKIVRDADMLDNVINVMVNEDMTTFMNSRGATVDEFWSCDISDAVFDTFMTNKSINYDIVNTPAEWWLSMVAYIFNMSLIQSLQIVKESNSIDKVFNRVTDKFTNQQTNERIKSAYMSTKKYVHKVV